MKRFLTIAILITIIAVCVMFCGCNKRVFDFVYEYDRAIITLPNGDVVEGRIDNWRDYEDGDQIQVQIDGKIYLVHSSDIVLIQD